MLRRALIAASSSAPRSSSSSSAAAAAAAAAAFRRSANPHYSRLLVTDATVTNVTNNKRCKARRRPADCFLSTSGAIHRYKSTKAESESTTSKATIDSTSTTTTTGTSTTTTTNTTTNTTGGIYGLLSADERQILLEQRELTTTARALASDILVRHRSHSSISSSSNNSNSNISHIVDPFPSTTLLQDLELDSTFAIVVTGEFNAGKSTLINALLGQKVLESGAIPTTDSITILAGTKEETTTHHKKDNTATDSTTATTTPMAKTTFTPPTTPQPQPSLSTNPHSNSSSSSPSSSPPLGVVLHSIPHQPLLRDLTIIDTPGTNAPLWMDHTDRTLKLLPAADLILFVTSADRPMTESERQLMAQIQRAYRKPIVVVLNKMDILNAAGGDQGAIPKQQVLDFVIQNVTDVLVGGASSSSSSSSDSSSGSPHPHHPHHHQVMVLPVSAKDALSAKLMAKKSSSSSSTSLDNNNNDNNNNDIDSYLSSNIWQRSNFQALEHFLKDSLTTKTRIQSKLTSPIGVLEGVMDTCIKVLKEQDLALQEDVATLNLLEQQWTSWKDQLEHELQLARHDMVDLMLYESKRVSLLLSPERMKWYELYSWTLIPSDYPSRLLQQWEDTNHPSLVGRRLQGRYQQSPSSGNYSSNSSTLEEELLSHVRETADAVATRGRAQGQAVIEYLGTRPAKNHQSLVGSVTAASRFEDTKQVLTERWTEAVQSILGSSSTTSGGSEMTGTDTTTPTPSQQQQQHPKGVLESLRKTAMVAATFHAGGLASAMALATTVVSTQSSSSILMSDPFLFSSSSFMVMASCWGMAGLVHTQGTSRIAKRYSDEWSRKAKRLDESLTVIGAKELDRVQRRILQGVSPYTRFVASEQERIHQSRESCERVVIAARQLRNRIKKL